MTNYSVYRHTDRLILKNSIVLVIITKSKNQKFDRFGSTNDKKIKKFD